MTALPDAASYNKLYQRNNQSVRTDSELIDSFNEESIVVECINVEAADVAAAQQEPRR